MKHLMVLVIALLFVFTSAFAADTTNTVASKYEDDFAVLYYGVANVGVAGGTDKTSTQWMRIDFVDIGNNPGTIQVWCTDITGTEDLNGYIQFSNSTTAATFKELATDTGLDAIAITVKWDTVGVAMGIKTFGARYMRLLFDGQTSSPHDVDINWYVYFNKPAIYAKRRFSSVGNCL